MARHREEGREGEREGGLITPVLLLLPVADVLSEYRALYKAISTELFYFLDLCRAMLRFLFPLFFRMYGLLGADNYSRIYVLTLGHGELFPYLVMNI